jgi:hypothetical protein
MPQGWHGPFSQGWQRLCPDFEKVTTSKTPQRAIAGIVGAVVFGTPAVALLRYSLTLGVESQRARLLPLIVGLCLLYGAVVVGAILHVRDVRRVLRARRIRRRDVFVGGLFGSVVVFLLGFVVASVAWLTGTELGRLTPRMAVFGLLIGMVLSAAVTLMVYAVVGTTSIPREHPGQQ